MSKVNAMQALREARYAARAAERAADPTARAVAAVSQVETASPRPIPPADAVAALRGLPAAPSEVESAAGSAESAAESAAGTEAEVEPSVAGEPSLCGHRSINNRTCRRPAGHAEKNHRYN